MFRGLFSRHAKRMGARHELTKPLVSALLDAGVNVSEGPIKEALATLSDGLHVGEELVSGKQTDRIHELEAQLAAALKTKTPVPSAEAQSRIVALETQLGEQKKKVGELTSQLTDASGKAHRVDSLVAEVAVLKEQLKDEEARHQSAVASEAARILAASGHPPVSMGPGSDFDDVTVARKATSSREAALAAARRRVRENIAALNK
jgi:uncharacterized coiled-coil protein SlyX